MKYYYLLIIVLLIIPACAQDDNEIFDNEKDEQPSRVEILLEKFNNPEGEIMVAAHRGHWKNVPENSLSSIQSMIDIGGEIVELDVRITLDRDLVVIHDKTLERTTTGIGKVSHTRTETIRNLKLKDSQGNIVEETVPTLEEALLFAKGKIMVMIDKWSALAPEVLEVVERTGTKHQVLLLGFEDFPTTQNLLGAHMDSLMYIPGVHKVTENLSAYISGFQSGAKPAAFAFWFDTDQSNVLGHISTVQATSRVWINTTASNQSGTHTDDISLSNPSQGWGWVIEKGANVILTNESGALIQYLKDNDLRE